MSTPAEDLILVIKRIQDENTALKSHIGALDESLREASQREAELKQKLADAEAKLERNKI